MKRGGHIFSHPIGGSSFFFLKSPCPHAESPINNENPLNTMNGGVGMAMGVGRPSKIYKKYSLVLYIFICGNSC